MKYIQQMRGTLQGFQVTTRHGALYKIPASYSMNTISREHTLYDYVTYLFETI